MRLKMCQYSQYESERHHSSAEDALTANIAVNKGEFMIGLFIYICVGYIHGKG